MAASLEVKDGKFVNPKDKGVKTLKLYLEAAGVSSTELARAGKPEEQIKALAKGLSKREFLG
jgi:hypothetical protein